MEILVAWVTAHALKLLGIYICFSALVGSMPPVGENAPYAVKWVYGFLHLIAMNLTQAAALLPLPDFVKNFVVKEPKQ